MKNEMIQKLPFAEYQAIPAINASAIKDGRKSMLHMRHYLTASHRKATPAMIKGGHLHTCILEPDLFPGALVVWIGGDKRKNAGEWEKFKAGHGEENVVTPEYLGELSAIRDAVYRNAHARKLIEASKTELTFTWKHDKYGAGKCRADGYSSKYGLLELKTTAQIEVDRFIRQGYNLGYHTASGWYYHGINIVTDNDCQAVNFIVVESCPPYDCYVMPVPFPIIERGKTEAIEIAARYHAHELTGNFPGVTYGASIEYHLPPYAISDEVDMGGIE